MLGDLADGDGGDGKVMARQLETGIADDESNAHGQDSPDEHAHPGADSQLHEHERGGVGPRPEEDGMPQGDLPGVPPDHVPGQPQGGVKKNHDHQVAGEG